MVASASDSEGFSPSNTLITFDPPLPLLRVPIPAGSQDDPSIGPFVLAFRDAANWRFALRQTESRIIEQCEEGARIGCSISASKKCKPPWWKVLFRASAVDFTEREKCEQLEMEACLAASRESCIKFAKEKCSAPFRDARIAFSAPNMSAKFSSPVTTYRGSVLLLDNDSDYKKSPRDVHPHS